MIGNGGDSPDGSGGMIPSTAPPFAMTRWVAQTRRNYVSVTPYNVTGTRIYGSQGTHQPAIWMGESATVTVVPGTGEVRTTGEDRGMRRRGIRLATTGLSWERMKVALFLPNRAQVRKRI